MRLISRIFGRKRSVNPATKADQEWSDRVRGVAVLQTAEEQQVTRRQIEDQLDAQREGRARGTSPDA